MIKKTYSNEEVTKKYQSLPEEVKNLLYGFEMTSIITKVGEKNSLHIDQMDKLNTETGYVMMGLTETADFPSIIAQDLQIDEAKAQAVAKDINDMLFIKIRESMKKPSLATVIPLTTTSAPPTMPPSRLPPLSPKPVAPMEPPVALLEVKPELALPKPEVKEVKIDLDSADMMLSSPTVAKTTAVTPAAPAVPAQTEPPKPQGYKADPYREPAN